MRFNKCKNYHISIEYWGGEVITRYSEYLQTLRLFKNVDKYGNARVVVCSSSWFEMEYTIKNNESEHFLMLSNGKLLSLGFLNKKC